MKKLIILPCAVVLLVIMLLNSGCRKSLLPESWTWESAVYTTTSCSVNSGAAEGFSNATLLAVQSGPNKLQVAFNGGFPTKSGIDTVVAWGHFTSAGQVAISLVAGDSTFRSTGNGYSQTVNVTVFGSSVTVAALQISPVELLNTEPGSTDSAGIYFSLVN